jgi:hypothetical protein
MVCSEVVYRAFDGLDGTEFELRKRAGRLTLAPEDLIQMALANQSFDIIACYLPANGPELESGEAAIETIRATLK